MTEPWDPSGVGVLRLPSGRLVRGRGLRRPMPPGPVATFTVWLLWSAPDVRDVLDRERPGVADGGSRWLRWPDFWLPTDRTYAREVLLEAWERTVTERVEVVCGGGRGRTGTALACVAVLDGVPADEAVAFVRRHYHPGAVETPWQKRHVRRFSAAPRSG